jgi:N-acetylneuraminic acid mutarotase
MKKQTEVACRAHVVRGASYLLLLVTGTVMAFFGSEAPTKVLPGTLGFAERFAYQRAIEEVYWRHRIWPKENPDPKPSLEAVMSQGQLEKKVEDYLLNSQALEDYYKEPLSAEQLQGEMDRMATHTKQPEVLRELFEALGNDPFVIAECLARSVLAERMTTSLHVTQTKTGRLRPNVVAGATVNYTLPTISDAATGCIDDTWSATSTSALSGRTDPTAVWTGSEMIVWGGRNSFGPVSSGGKYDPSTDTWTATSAHNAPQGRQFHTAVWSGSEMIVWGGLRGTDYLNTGGRYNPSTNTWTAPGTANAPSGREYHAAIWTGSEMIIWGGYFYDGTGGHVLNTGGRYNPSTDTWTATNTAGAPSARAAHTSVWSGSAMIVWGGYVTFVGDVLNTGGRYDPSTDSWTTTSAVNVPGGRESHTAVWTGSEMIVWGGFGGGSGYLNTGGRYDPNTDSWTATNITNAPTARYVQTAVWTGNEMIVWGGYTGDWSNTGGRYNPGTDMWTTTSAVNVPDGRESHTAVWTGSEMIVWGGYNGFLGYLNTGGRYCAQSGAPTPTPTPGPITLSARKKKMQGINTVRLAWTGAASANIDVYRNGVVVATTVNDGSYDDSTGDTGQAQYMYMVCEAGTQTCSNEVVVMFPR